MSADGNTFDEEKSDKWFEAKIKCSESHGVIMKVISECHKKHFPAGGDVAKKSCDTAICVMGHLHPA